MNIEAVLSIVLGFSGIYLLLELASESRRRVRSQLALAVVHHDASSSGRERQLALGIRARLVRPTVNRLARLTLGLTPGAAVGNTRRRLLRAGMRVDPQVFLATKSGLALLALAAGVLALALGSASQAIAALALAVAAFKLPDALVTMAHRSRRQAIDRSLPDMLDLLTVSVEAGLGFDAAAMKTAARMRGPLVEELQIMLQQIRLGATRQEALQEIGIRSGSDEVAAFARALNQSERLGVALGPALRVQASEMRRRRQLVAEERAMKAPVKMMFPTVVFIFPAMFIVVVAPAFISVMDTFQ